MPPKRPIELVNASQACSEAWAKRDEMIEANDSVGIMAMNSACGILDYHYSTLYQEWQILGGTSNIDSLAFPFVGEIPTARPFEPRNQFTACVEYEDGCGYDDDMPSVAIGR